MSGLVDLNGNPLSSKASAGMQAGGMLRSGPVALDALLQPMAANVHSRGDKLVTGHAYARGGVQLHADFVVGERFRLQLKPDWALLGVDPKVGRQWAKDVERRFHDYADDDRAFCDAEGKRTFTMMMRELTITHTRRNEGFVQSTWVKRQGTNSRTCFKLVSPDRISNPRGIPNTDSLKYGVKVGRYGRPLSYYARDRHPSDPKASAWREIKAYLPWGRRQMMHLFEPWEDGQVRAVSDLMAAVRRVELLDQFQDAILQNAISNAFIAATIESEMDSETMRQAILGGQDAENDPLKRYMTNAQEYHSGTDLRLNGLRVPHLLPNEKFATNRGTAPTGISDFESSILRYLSSDLGVSYEMLSRDFSKTNYASARAGWAQSFVFFCGRRALVPARAGRMMLINWLEEQVIERGLALPPGVTDFYAAQNALTRCKWLGTGKPSIDGLKEVKESIERLQGGISTLEDEMAVQGKDYDEVMEQQAIEEAELAERGLVAPWKSGKQTTVLEFPGVNTHEQDPN